MIIVDPTPVWILTVGEFFVGESPRRVIAIVQQPLVEFLAGTPGLPAPISYIVEVVFVADDMQVDEVAKVLSTGVSLVSFLDSGLG